MNLDNVLIEPVLTDKAYRFGANKQKKYVFKVNKAANKLQVMEAIRVKYKVHPMACNIVNVKSKKRSNMPVSAATFKRGFGFTAAWKKAVVTLSPGEEINI